jgi:hypothetical protein
MTILRVLLLAMPIILFGCTTPPDNKASNQMQSPAPVEARSAQNTQKVEANEAIQKKLNTCITQASATEQAKLIDGEVIAINPSSPNAKALYNSSDKLTDKQAETLKAYKWATQKCSQISNQFKDIALRKIYQDYFSKIDVVYADLMAKKITIGVANQERSLLMSDARMHWKEEMQK